MAHSPLRDAGRTPDVVAAETDPALTADVDAAPSPAPREDLEDVARRGRLMVVEAVARAGGGHVGGPLSVMELLVALYFRVLRVDPRRPDWRDRDRFVLSKGHCASALYAVMAMRGFFDTAELATFDEPGSRLQAHPDMTVLPGLDASTGSLGQGVSVALGMALAARLDDADHHTFALLGDGEMQEGQVWEAVQVAATYRLGNLTILVDHNGMQQYGWPLPAGAEHRGDRRDPFGEASVAAALEAFGWRVTEVDGHDVEAIAAACDAARARAHDGRPSAILARTVKGRGLSFATGVSSWHSRGPTDDEVAAARRELGVA